MNPSPTNAGWRSDFEKKRTSRTLEEKMVGVWPNYRGYHHVHDHHDVSHNCYVTEEKEIVMDLVHSQRSCLDLMQNCDLPPPLKVFAGAADKTVLTSMRPPRPIIINQEDEFPIPTEDSVEEEKLRLLKALQLSQTRARAAERKATLMTQERDRLSDSLLEESLRLFAHRQWVKLLELEVSKLRSQKQEQQQLSCCGCDGGQEKGSSEEVEKKDNGGDVGSLTWCMALALCLGIAGVGFAFGYRYLF